MIHVSYSTAHACNIARSTACSSYWQSHRKKDSQRDCHLLHELLPYLGCPFEPDLTRGRLTLKPYIARSHTYSVQHDRERKFQRDIDKRAAAILRQPSPLTYYFVFHHFSGLYMCDIDSFTACRSSGLPAPKSSFLSMFSGLNISCLESYTSASKRTRSKLPSRKAPAESSPAP